MITSNEVDKILPALFELKKKLKPMTKDSKNPFFKSNYLKLEDLLDNLEPLLIDQGILVTQANAHRHGDEYVISRLTHAESGQFVEAEYKIGFIEDSQKQGAKSSYGRRFSLKGLLGLSERDDDGESVSGRSSAPAYKAPSKPSSDKPAEAPKASGGFGGAPAPAKAALGGFGAPAQPVEAKPEVKPAPAKAPARSGSFGQ